MSDTPSWPWLALFLLGAYHGINPAMGWLFAVALGMQEHRRGAVVRALLPISLGHTLAIGVVVALIIELRAVFPLIYLKIPVVALLVGFGLYRLVRQRHPRWGGMQVGFRDLTIWSFLMATAHGAGFMILPVLLGMPANAHAGHAALETHGYVDFHPGAVLHAPLTGLLATLIHTAGYLAVTGLVALVVYEKLGLAMLRKAWVNLDLVWAGALIATGCFTLLI